MKYLYAIYVQLHELGSEWQQPMGQGQRGTAKGALPKGHQTKGAWPKGHSQRGMAKGAFNTKGAGSQDLKLCSDVPTVNFVDTWTLVSVFVLSSY